MNNYTMYNGVRLNNYENKQTKTKRNASKIQPSNNATGIR